VISSGGDPGLRPIAIANAADAVADLHFIDIVYDGELDLEDYAEILLEQDNPMPCYRPGNKHGQPDFSWHFTRADIPEIIRLAAARIAGKVLDPVIAPLREQDGEEAGLGFP
jgi:hypothetical protein